jgi:hypothetical protein
MLVFCTDSLNLFQTQFPGQNNALKACLDRKMTAFGGRQVHLVDRVQGKVPENFSLAILMIPKSCTITPSAFRRSRY